jgi:hypothetical protein
MHGPAYNERNIGLSARFCLLLETSISKDLYKNSH